MATVLPTKPGPNVPDARSSALRKRGGGSRFLPGDRAAPRSPTGGCRSRVGGRVRCGQAPLARGPSSRAPCGDGAPNSAIPMLLGGRFGPPPPEPRAQRERQRPSVGPAPTCGRGEVGWRHGAVRGGRVAASWHRESCQIQARCLDQAAKERDPHRREPFIQPA